MLYTLRTSKKYLSRAATSILSEVPCCLTEFNEDGSDENELGRLYINSYFYFFRENCLIFFSNSSLASSNNGRNSWNLVPYLKFQASGFTIIISKLIHTKQHINHIFE